MRSPITGSTIAFVTSKEYPHLTPTDLIAAEALRAAGGSVLPAVWDDPLVDWAGCDAIVIRSTWDYHLRPGEFVRWIDSLEQKRARLWNPPNILRWNMDKHYLLDVKKSGTPIPRTVFIEKKASFDGSGLRMALGTDRVVVKPVISAASWNTWRCSLEDFTDQDARRLASLLDSTGVMVQEYMPEVPAEGEWSMIFFGGRFSHALKKYPARGDFRVQEELGGWHEFQPSPPPEILRQASKALEAIETPLLYARVDGIVREGALIVMELELLEPSLYFDVDPKGAERFSEQLAVMMSR
jgi:glutathione synthase/RimK-type ligase-like ATP-grasp enzyme